MKVEVEFEVGASPDEVMARMQGAAFLEQLTAAIELVEGIEEVERSEQGERLERRLRYEARTKLPKFLKRYEDRAPERVYWEERGVWEAGARRYRYEIVPEVPEHWHELYENGGVLEIRPSAGGSRVRIVFEYSVKIPVFGMSSVVERALRGEIEKILEIQGRVLRGMVA